MKQKIIMSAVLLFLVGVTLILLATDVILPDWAQVGVILVDCCALCVVFSNWDDHDNDNKTRFL